MAKVKAGARISGEIRGIRSGPITPRVKRGALATCCYGMYWTPDPTRSNPREHVIVECGL